MSLERRWYRVARAIVEAFCRLFWRLEVIGGEHIPTSGAFVLAPIHRSNIDTLIAACVSKRRLRFMAKDSMWSFTPVGWLLSSLGGFPVRRGMPDREALRVCEQTLAAGEPVVVFPEGGRRSGPTVGELFDGPSFLACRQQVPLVPLGIGGSERAMPKGSPLLRPVKVVMIIAEPLQPPSASEDRGSRVSRRSVKELTASLVVSLQKVYDEAEAASLRKRT